MKSLLLLALLITSTAAPAQRIEPTVETLTEAHAEKVIFLNPEYLAYHPKRPDTKAKLPLVIYLHGGGGTGDEIRKITGQSRGLVHALDRFKKRNCLVVAPQCRRGSDKSDLRGTWEPADLDIFLAHLLEKHDYLDPDRVYLTGNSMGGYGSWVWGGTSPQHFAAIAPIVGGTGRGGPKDVSPDIEKWAKNLAKVPLYGIAGAQDKVVPADRTEQMVALIRKAGGKKVRIKVYPEEGHGAGRKAYQDEDFFNWMFAQKRSSAD